MSTPRYIWQRPDWPKWRWSESALARALDTVQRKQDFLAGLAQALDADHLGLAVTASRDLSRLEALSVIEKDPSMAGRNTRYRVHLEDPQPLQLVKNLAWS
jgi:hypothetical protein